MSHIKILRKAKHIYKSFFILFSKSSYVKGDIMNKFIFYPILISLGLFASYCIVQTRSITTISYFPIDDTVSFTEAQTKMTVYPKPNDHEYSFTWEVQSESEQPLYLRQDISLLYEQGQFKGVLSKWEEQTSQIYTEKTFSSHDHSYYQAISFHHGEV